jgi:hypothetical protein
MIEVVGMTEISEIVLSLLSNSLNNQYHTSFDRGGGHDKDNYSRCDFVSVNW